MDPARSIAQLVGGEEWPAVNAGGRPYVVYKYAATLDGRIAAADTTSKWITSAQSRSEVHELRAACDATVVGSGTQRADDPHLAVRGNDDPKLPLGEPETVRQPLRVIVDSSAGTPSTARVLDDAAPTLIAVAEDADASHLEGLAEVLRLPRSSRGLDLHALLGALHRRDVRCVFLEGGPTLAGSFIAARLVDRVIGYVAPVFLGAGKAALGEAGITTIADALRLELLHLDRSGPDLRLVARLPSGG